MPYSTDPGSPAAVLMVQGCASGVGKSLITAGLCRFFRRRGLSVAPFKAQNLSLNSWVTAEGGEIGRSTAVQAAAAGVEPTVDMNPLLLKPEAGGASQLVALGRPMPRAEAEALRDDRDARSRLVLDALARLRARHDLVVIEGAGSPAEINLRSREVVNMHVAVAVQAPVLLVGDIERGGVFAHLVGTLELLEPEERALVAGLAINRFHGSVDLLRDGVTMLEERTGVPVLGVLPWLADHGVADEDSADLDRRGARRRAGDGEVEVAIVRFPHLSNHDEFQPLEREPDVVVRYVTDPEELFGADLVVLPGTKDTRADLAWARANGLADAVRRVASEGGRVLGICGGYQMLGRSIVDLEGVEGSAGESRGLDLLPVDTVFGSTKTTRRRSVRVAADPAELWGVETLSDELDTYEIHMGVVRSDAGTEAPFHDALTGEPEGACQATVVGTTLHGLFESASLRAALVRGLGGRPRETVERVTSTDAHDLVADWLDANLDLVRISRIAKVPTT